MFFFKQYCVSIVEIIETKQSFLTPKFSYYIMIMVLFFQVAGYILSTFEIKPLNEQVIYTVGSIAENSTGTFLLYITGNDTLTMFFCILIDGLMLFYFLYVAFFTYCKIYSPKLLAKIEISFQAINQVLNQFFTHYWWVFFTPLVEINSGVMVVGANSFLSQYRTTLDFSVKPLWQILLSIFGLLMTGASGIILLYCFRNYEFEEQNLLKRRFHVIQLLILFLRFLEIYFYYLNLTIIIPIKHMIAHLCGIAVFCDFFMNIPIQNIEISKFYIVSFVSYEILMISSSLWMFTFVLPDNEMFYFVALLSMFVCPIMIRLYEIRMHSFMQLTFQDYDKLDHHHLDLSLENLLHMFRQSNKDKYQKIQFLLYMKFHIHNCSDVNCTCHTFTIQENKTKSRIKARNNYKFGITINLTQLIQFCELQFKRAITEECVLKNQELFEHYQLKLISFIAKYKDNSPLSYFELKRLLAKNSNVSFFFKLVSQVYAGVLQKQIELYGHSDASTYKYDPSDKGLEHMIELTQALDTKIQEASVFIRSVVKLKLNFWTQAQEGFQDFSIQKQVVEQTVQQILFQFTSIDTQMRQFEQKYSKKLLQSHVLYQKIEEMIECYVYNNQNRVLQCKKEIVELKKKDYFKPQIYINNYNLQQGQVVHLQIGISNTFGQILKGNNSNMLAKFFGYTLAEIGHIQSINTFIPRFISQYHDIMMVDFLQNSDSNILTTTRQVYLRDKHRFIFLASIDIRNIFGFSDNMVYFVTLLKHPNSNQFILFDDGGYIIGMTQQIFKKIFRHQLIRQEHKQSQTQEEQNQEFYAYLLRNVPFQLICPDIIELMNKIREMVTTLETQSTSVSNRTIMSDQSSKIQVSSSFHDHVDNYVDIINKKFYGIQKSHHSSNKSRDQSYSQRSQSVDQPSLLKKSDLVCMKETIQRLSQSYHHQNDAHVMQIKFKLHLTYKSFENADITLIQQQSESKSFKQPFLRYFAMEITEFMNQDKIEHMDSANKSGDMEFRQVESLRNQSLTIQIPHEIDQNLSSIQGGGGFTIASEVINDDLQILSAMEGYGFGSPPFQIIQKIVNESILDEIEDSKILAEITHPINQSSKDIVHSNKRQQFKPLVFLKNQILFEDAPHFEEEDQFKSNLVSPRQTARVSTQTQYMQGLLRDQNGEPQEEEKSEIAVEPQIFTPRNQINKKLTFKSKEKNGYQISIQKVQIHKKKSHKNSPQWYPKFPPFRNCKSII